MSKNPKKSFEEFVKENFLRVVQKKSEESLGNRAKYIGGSDVGGCPYKVINSKLRKIPPTFKQAIIQERGHMAEDMIAMMLTDISYDRQAVVRGELDNFPLKAHLDFLIKGRDRNVIVEAKTVSSPIDVPYESWILQVQFQMGLLMNEISNESHSLDAYIIAMDVNTGWEKFFKIKFNDDLFLMALNKACHLIDCLQNKAEPKAVIQYYCSDCPFKDECPKQGLHAKELPEDILSDVKEIKAYKNKAKEIKSREEKVKEYLVNTCVETGKVEDLIDGFSAIVTCKESKSNRFNTNKFKKDHPDLYEEYVNESSSFRLSIK